MYCPYCKNSKTSVVDKRDQEEGNLTRRRRECSACKKRFTTYEKVQKVDLTVLKNDGTDELFDREKLKKSITKSLTKSNSEEIAEQITDDIEKRILSRQKLEVTSKELGDMILTRLKRLDKTAYMRYASVYKGFSKLEDFVIEIRSLIND
ncbi:transcriptional repressor NrdR [Candidatus Dojkabacteria bacterium]|nr:transcriptional repressor NrdR [Candidatus Dojkabacteria bacterium]